MKSLFCSLLLTFNLSYALAEELPPVEEAYEVYHYCLYEIEVDDSDENHNAELLFCVNNELSKREYSTFASLGALLRYIQGYMNGNDEGFSGTTKKILNREGDMG